MARSHLEATYMTVNCIYCTSESSPTSPSRLCHVLDWFSIVHNCLPSPRTSGHEFDMNCCSCVTSNVSHHQTWCLHSAASQRAAVITVWGLNKDLGKQQHVAFAVSFTTVQSQCWAGRQGGGSTHVLTHTTRIRSNISCEVHLKTTSLVKKRHLDTLNENVPKNLLYDFMRPSGKEPTESTWKGRKRIF